MNPLSVNKFGIPDSSFGNTTNITNTLRISNLSQWREPRFPGNVHRTRPRISGAGNPSFLGTSSFCERRRHKQICGTTSVHFYGSFDNRGTTVPEGQQISTRKSFDPYRDGPS
ncbi:hypothetical protein TNIN_104211 [Trichonephila inaurata madagascariensis]|uniref:Uncharacterized protein n=1 Tax=Trichonephila inaurata madagascariensis TaxID=2747483 RepID=A0A8X6XF97_9ARAC|nr:hypothetical protein TNIN_104211 [Trichonephila inaurata madagascariensis]